MLTRLKRFFGRLQAKSLQRSDYGTESKQPVENTDALAASGMRDADPSGGMGANTFPPTYVPPADEGRPRH
jgi:hypothetical protein